MHKIFNGEDFQVLTHFDLDGAGGPLLLRHCVNDQITKVYPCGYGKILSWLQKNYGKNLFISDLSLSQEEIETADMNFANVIWADHHETSQGLDYPEHWKIMITMKCSATKIIYLWLKHIGYDVECAKSFVDNVDDYDMWIHKIPSSMMLNNIFWELSFWKFTDAFRKFTFNKDLWKKAKELQEEKLIEIASYENYCIEDTLRVVIGKKYVSDIKLFYPNEEHIIILTGKSKMSIRSSLDLSNFYKELEKIGIKAGGHKNAGGVDFKGEPMVVIELFYDFIKKEK